MRNNDSKQSMNASAMTVDEVENITGMDFFPNLPDKIENKVESEMSIKIGNNKQKIKTAVQKNRRF